MIYAAIVCLMPAILQHETQFRSTRASARDFDGVFYDTTYTNARFIASPYETWLAFSDTPAADLASDWFRSSSARNKVISSNILLSTSGEIDPVNGKATYRFYNGSYWPLNGKGYGSEGQIDCFTMQMQNQGYRIPSVTFEVSIVLNGSVLCSVRNFQG